MENRRSNVACADVQRPWFDFSLCQRNGNKSPHNACWIICVICACIQSTAGGFSSGGIDSPWQIRLSETSCSGEIPRWTVPRRLHRCSRDIYRCGEANAKLVTFSKSKGKHFLSWQQGQMFCLQGRRTQDGFLPQTEDSRITKGSTDRWELMWINIRQRSERRCSTVQQKPTRKRGYAAR